MRYAVRISLAAVLVLAVGCAHRSWVAPGVTLALGDPAGVAPKPLDALEVGDSLSVGLSGATPNAPVEFLLQDERGREWSYARVHSDARGNVPSTLFWYQSGVIGTTTRPTRFKPDPSFLTFEEAETFFENNPLRLIVREARGRELARQVFRPKRRQTPFVYPSNAEGILENAVNARTEDLYVSGRNFPRGATVNLFLVPNRFGWRAGDAFTAMAGAVRRVQLGPNETRFTARVWDRGAAQPGAYDIIARVADQPGRAVVSNDDIISFGDDTGVILYMIINGNVVIDSAGRMKDSPAYFEFSDSFEKGQDVYAAVDPTDVPAMHPGGNYAAYWTVAHQPAAYWDAPAPALVDVSSDGRDIARVKYWCINGTRHRIWPAATQTAPMAAYDVVVDFGSVPANDHTQFVDDNKYDKGVDFIDGYSAEGFWVFEDPGTSGSALVGTVEYLDPAGISGITDPTGMTGPTEPVTLGWARIMYPATMAGTAMPVAGGPLPIAVFLHGRHVNCDADGSGPGLTGSYSTCPQSQRVPSHEGYNYIMERLASQGIFCISINTYDIQTDLGAWDYNARGRLVLKFLDKLRDWTTSGTDPFGGLFNGKLDMSRVALSGHSRGGEGVVAAQVLNATWPTPHSILAVNAIAPTDQDWNTHYLPSMPYYLLVGARDGDVSTMQGFRTYDHAYPQGMVNRKAKAVAYVFGANHNYFNTIWTDTAALGTPNPWARSEDDCPAPFCTDPMTAAAQRQVALTTISAFFRWHLQGITPYREILTGRVQPSAMDNAKVFWTFQDGDRSAIDDFEQQPPFAPATNSVMGNVTAPGFTKFEERLLSCDGTWYVPAPANDWHFCHDTIGLKLGWGAGQTYTTNIPAGPARDASAFSHLTFRAAKWATGVPTTGPDVTLFVNVEDNMGRQAAVAVQSSAFGRIPHPFAGSLSTNLSQMAGIRIPLRYFTRNNSQVDLTNIVKITIQTTGTAEIGIDDIEFGK